jgi:hypothetical protein
MELCPEWEYGCNRCIICDGSFKHYRGWIKEPGCDLYLLKEKLCHARCQKIVKEIKKKQMEIKQLEWELFERKIFN